METHATTLLMKKITPTTLVTLDLGGKRPRSLSAIAVMTWSPVPCCTWTLALMTEMLRANVAIELVGEAPVLDEVPNTLINQSLNELEIEALRMTCWKESKLISAVS